MRNLICGITIILSVLALLPTKAQVVETQRGRLDLGGGITLEYEVVSLRQGDFP